MLSRQAIFIKINQKIVICKTQKIYTIISLNNKQKVSIQNGA